MEAGLKEGRVYCEVKCSKNPSVLNKSTEEEKKKEVTQRTDVRGARKQTERKKRAHQELSLRGRRSEREQRREGLGESFLKEEGGGGLFFCWSF